MVLMRPLQYRALQILPIEPSHQERQLKRLLLIKSWITEGRVPLSQTLLGQSSSTTDTLCNRLTG